MESTNGTNGTNGTAGAGIGTVPTLTPSEAKRAVSSFVRFLGYETVSSTAPSTGAYVECASFLLDELRSVPCLEDVHLLEEAPEHSPVVVARWRGVDEALPVILLNGHYDVVPAEMRRGWEREWEREREREWEREWERERERERGDGKEEEVAAEEALNVLDAPDASGTGWTVPPFEGVVRDGKIYGRGSQDMKCVCIQYIEALRKLHALDPSYRPLRSIYITLVPDEEVGGGGMASFLSSALYNALPGIALALDEGLASESDAYSVFYGERLPWWVDVTATGSTGHGSRFIEPTAVGRLLHFANLALDFRSGQKQALHGSDGRAADHSNCSHAVAAKRRRLAKERVGAAMALGDVTSLNITTIRAGVQAGNGDFVYNVVPPTASLSLDVRISPHMDPVDMKDLLDTWCRECSAPSQSTPPSTAKADSDAATATATATATQNARSGGAVTWSYIGSQQGNVTPNDLQKHSLTSTDSKVNPWYDVFANAMSYMGRTITPEVFPAATDSRFLRALGIRALGFSPMNKTEILLHEDDEYIPQDLFLDGIGVYVKLIEALGNAKVES